MAFKICYGAYLIFYHPVYFACRIFDDELLLIDRFLGFHFTGNKVSKNYILCSRATAKHFEGIAAGGFSAGLINTTRRIKDHVEKCTLEFRYLRLDPFKPFVLIAHLFHLGIDIHLPLVFNFAGSGVLRSCPDVRAHDSGDN